MEAAPGEGAIHCSALPALRTDSTVVPVLRVEEGKELFLGRKLASGHW